MNHISSLQGHIESSRFEYLEHIDDDLSWDGVQAAVQAALRPWRSA